jgi:hypothetical protein
MLRGYTHVENKRRKIQLKGNFEGVMRVDVTKKRNFIKRSPVHETEYVFILFIIIFLQEREREEKIKEIYL